MGCGIRCSGMPGSLTSSRPRPSRGRGEKPRWAVDFASLGRPLTLLLRSAPFLQEARSENGTALKPWVKSWSSECTFSPAHSPPHSLRRIKAAPRQTSRRDAPENLPGSGSGFPPSRCLKPGSIPRQINRCALPAAQRSTPLLSPPCPSGAGGWGVGAEQKLEAKAQPDNPELFTATARPARRPAAKTPHWAATPPTQATAPLPEPAKAWCSTARRSRR